MKTVTMNVFEYSELSEEAKDKVKHWYLDDAMLGVEYQRSVMEDLNLAWPSSELKFQYSLSHCQGDGVNTYGRIDLNDALNLFQAQYSEKEFRTLQNYVDNTSSTINLPLNRRYAYSIAGDLNFQEVMLDDLESLHYRDINTSLIESFENKIIRWFIDFNKKAEEFGYDYLYNVEEEVLAESCEENQWYFESNGSFYGTIV